MDDEEANQFGMFSSVEVGAVEGHEETGIKLMSFPTEALKSAQSFQVPPAWGIQLSINRLLEVHASLWWCAKNSKCLAGRRSHSWRSCGRPFKNAVETSAAQAFHRRHDETVNSFDLLSLLVVGLAVSRFPFKASTSLSPLTTNRALARGVPSACLDHFKRILLVKVLSGKASGAVENSHTPRSKNDCNSFTLA